MQTTTDTRARLLASARELIYQRSYADVGVAAICAHAGVKKGSFYHFFASKQELTMAVLEETWRRTSRALDRAFSPDVPPMERILRKVKLLYRIQTDQVEQTGQLLGCPFGNLASELATQDDAIRLKVLEIFGHMEEKIRGALEEAVATGAAAPMDLDATAQAMMAYIEGVMLMAKTRNDPQVLARLLPAVTQIRVAPTP